MLSIKHDKKIGVLAGLLLGSLLVGSPVRAAGGMDTGGGYSARITGDARLFLYDFLEGGIEDSATIPAQIDDRMGALTVLGRALLLDRPLLEGVARKINEVGAKDEAYGNLLLDTFARLRWNIVRPELIPIADVGFTPLRLGPNLELFLTAFRDDARGIVYINKTLWDQLAPIHRVGLLFHEANYALMKRHTRITTSANPRSITSYFFDPRFDFANGADIRRELLNLGFPADVLTRATGHFRNDCAALKTEVATWASRIRPAFSDYVNSLEPRRKEYEVDLRQRTRESSHYVTILAADDRQTVGGEWFTLGSELGPERDRDGYILPFEEAPRIPRQIIFEYYGLRWGIAENVDASEYAPLTTLVEQGRQLKTRHAALSNLCIEGTGRGEDLYTLNQYSQLKPAQRAE